MLLLVFISHLWRLNFESRDQKNDEESFKWRWKFCWENKKALKSSKKEKKKQRELTSIKKY